MTTVLEFRTEYASIFTFLTMQNTYCRRIYKEVKIKLTCWLNDQAQREDDQDVASDLIIFSSLENSWVLESGVYDALLKKKKTWLPLYEINTAIISFKRSSFFELESKETFLYFSVICSYEANLNISWKFPRIDETENLFNTLFYKI